MKAFGVALIFACTVAVALAAEATVKYAGTSDGAPYWSPPTIDTSTSNCAASSFLAPYVVFNYTWTMNGVREVAAMAERAFKDEITTYIYKGTFSASTPCANLYSIMNTNAIAGTSSGGPSVDEWQYFEGGQVYNFVVSAATSNDSGALAVNIFPGISYGVVNSSSPQWPGVRSTSPDSPACDTIDTVVDSNSAHYSTYTWTQNSTGFYDIVALFSNNTREDDWSYTTVALFNGTLLANGSSDPCNVTATGATFNCAATLNRMGSYLPYVRLTAGSVYTIVFSGYTSDDIGFFAIQIIPTRIRFPTNSPTYTQPDRGAVSPCVPSTDDTVSSWDAVQFQAENRAYIIDTGSVPADYYPSFDTYSFLYRGSNLGSATSAPATCPLGAPLVYMGDTGDITPLYTFTTPGQNYTVVVSTYHGDVLSSGTAYVLYLFTGLPIGTLPSINTTTTGTGTTSKVSTTGVTNAATTGKVSTTALTTGRITTTSNTTVTGASSSSSSGASHVEVPHAFAAFVAVWIAFAVFSF